MNFKKVKGVVIALLFTAIQNACVAQEMSELVIERCMFMEESLEAEKRVYVESFLARPEITLTRDELSNKFDDRVFHIKKCHLPARVFRAKQNDEVVGVVVGILRKHGPAYLHLLAVLPTAQKQGIGRKLLDAFVSTWRPEAIELNVQKENRSAETFYRKYGFIDLGYNPSLFGEKKHSKNYTGLIWHNPAFLPRQVAKKILAQWVAFYVKLRRCC